MRPRRDLPIELIQERGISELLSVDEILDYAHALRGDDEAYELLRASFGEPEDYEQEELDEILSNSLIFLDNYMKERNWNRVYRFSLTAAHEILYMVEKGKCESIDSPASRNYLLKTGYADPDYP